jgi:hypothetical protein
LPLCGIAVVVVVAGVYAPTRAGDVVNVADGAVVVARAWSDPRPTTEREARG